MPRLVTDLPADLLQHIAVRIQLAYHIARAAPTCRVISVAARNAFKVRPFSGEVVTMPLNATAIEGPSIFDAMHRLGLVTGGTREQRDAAWVEGRWVEDSV